LADSKLPCDLKDFKLVKFDPSNSKEFALLSNTVMYFYKIHQAYEVTEQDD